MEEESTPVASKHVFAYFITIHNMGDQSVKLLKRHWEIEDSCGDSHEVDGEGVIGVQPTIKPGEDYEYNSFCVLKSYHGSMSGYYTMEREDGKMINVRIPKFQLSSHVLN